MLWLPELIIRATHHCQGPRFTPNLCLSWCWSLPQLVGRWWWKFLDRIQVRVPTGAEGMVVLLCLLLRNEKILLWSFLDFLPCPVGQDWATCLLLCHRFTSLSLMSVTEEVNFPPKHIEGIKVKSLSHVQVFATHGLQPTRLLCPWDFPGKDTGVLCHFLLQGISRVSCTTGRFFPDWATREALHTCYLNITLGGEGGDSVQCPLLNVFRWDGV